MRKIIIGASRNEKIGSKVIRWWMNTDYSHVFASWHLSSQERTIVYHAAHGMVHFKEFNNFKQENEVVQEIEIELTEEQFKAFSQQCIDLAGQPYSKLELLQIFISDLTNGKVSFQDQHGFICSELMAELLIDLGYKFNKESFLINPKDIMDNLEKAHI
jgi:hypothetical protein